jgi:hypothetical protein
MALGGDPVALRLCMERILPARKDRPVSFPLPPIASVRDAADIIGAIAAAVSNGAITPNEAAEISKVIDSFVKAHQVAELDNRCSPSAPMRQTEGIHEGRISGSS